MESSQLENKQTIFVNLKKVLIGTIFVNMALVKQLLLSFGGGLLLFCIWIVIIVVTSQDFTHEGPNSSWYLPIDAWGQVISNIGWAKFVSRLSPLLGTALGFVMLLSPFIILLSVVVHLATMLLCKMKAKRKLE